MARTVPPLLKTIALVHAKTQIVTLPPSSSLERQLPLFLTDDSEFYWFVLTSESGERWRCFALTEPDGALKLKTPGFSTAPATRSTAAGDRF